MKVEQKIDLVVSFDTTGSMYPVLAKVRQEVEKFTHEMFNDFSDFRLSIIAHGDYCDKDNPYTIRVLDFTKNEEKLCDFIRETKSTFGGDADECYELVLNTAYKELHWREDAERIMIMIGDASPHSPSYHMNKDNLDWKAEAEELRKQGIKVFSVHALANYRSNSRAFYKSVAETTGGIYLTLDMFNEIIDLIKATCYQQGGGEEKLNEFITIIREENRMTNSLDINFRRLKGEAIEEVFGTDRSYRSSSRTSRVSSEPGKVKELAKLEPVPAGRFQTFTVPENVDIKGFVTSMGIEFKKGRGFYELSKAETVQQYKEVIMQDRETGEMFVGSQVREELGLQPQTESGGVKERLHKSATEKFRVFVQSTSVNRKLIGGTTFLYEISDIEDTGSVIEEVKEESVKKDEVKKDEVKTTETKVADEVLNNEKFDTEYAKKSIERASEAEKTDTMTLAAASSKKTKKKEETSLKELAKSVDSLELSDIIKEDEKTTDEIEKVADEKSSTTTKSRKRAKKVSKDTEEVSSLTTSALDEVKQKKEEEQKKLEEKAEEKNRLQAEKEEQKKERERQKEEKEKLRVQKEKERAKALAEKERQKKKEEAEKEKQRKAKEKKDAKLKAKLSRLNEKTDSLNKYVAELSEKDNLVLTKSKIEQLYSKINTLNNMVNDISNNL